MQLVRYNPFKDLQAIENDLDKLWQSGWGPMPAFTESSAMDMYEQDGKLVAELSLPGFKKSEVKVTTDEGILEVSAEHKEEQEKKSKRRYFFRESSNQYLRRVTLPEGVKAEESDASFKDGILKITMPMPVKKQVKQVTVK